MSITTTLKTVEDIVKEARSSAEFISPEEAKNLLSNNNTLIIDVREPAEHNEASIPHAINIPRGVLAVSNTQTTTPTKHKLTRSESAR